MRWLWLALVLVPCVASAQTLMPGDPASQRPSGEPGRLTVQGLRARDDYGPQPRTPFAVSVAAGLVLEAGGLALTIPQLDVRHILGMRYDANRTLGYLGLSAMVLSPVASLFLSGGKATTAITGGLIELVLVSGTFGFAYLADAGFRAGPAAQAAAVAPLVIAGIGALGSVAFPLFMSFSTGAQIDAEEGQAEPSFGLMPVRGGAAVFVAARF